MRDYARIVGIRRCPVLQPNEIAGPDLYRKTGTHRGNIKHWAGVADVDPIRLEAFGGRNVNVWPVEAIEKINAARKSRGVTGGKRRKRAR